MTSHNGQAYIVDEHGFSSRKIPFKVTLQFNARMTLFRAPKLQHHWRRTLVKAPNFFLSIFMCDLCTDEINSTLFDNFNYIE